MYLMEIAKNALREVCRSENELIREHCMTTHDHIFLRTVLEAALLRMNDNATDGEIAESLSLVLENYRTWLGMDCPADSFEKYTKEEWRKVHLGMKALADNAWLVKNTKEARVHD